jgi:pimeloyl-ACP methyl ester carboxylesterase
MVGIFVTVFLGTAWYYSGQIRSGALVVDHKPNNFDLHIVDIAASDGPLDSLGGITLSGSTMLIRAGPGAPANEDWSKDGRIGLEFPNGYAQLGRVVDRHPDSVRREILSITSNRCCGGPGEPARADPFFYPSDPRVAVGFDFSEVEIPSSAGTLPAWLVPGTRSTWIIFVHGKGADRREGLRLLSALTPGEFPFLDITYRNDTGTLRDGYFGYGETEWPDLEAAIAFAGEKGAADVILAGNSMGGAIVLSFIQESGLAARVRGLILDSPVIDLASTIDFQGKRRGLPALLTDLSKWLVRRRFGLDWNALDYRGETLRLKVPVLLFHGEADRTVPVSTSDQFARARPDIVTYVRVPHAGHVRSWNQDPEAYARALISFVAKPCLSQSHLLC